MTYCHLFLVIYLYMSHDQIILELVGGIPSLGLSYSPTNVVPTPLPFPQLGSYHQSD